MDIRSLKSQMGWDGHDWLSCTSTGRLQHRGNFCYVLWSAFDPAWVLRIYIYIYAAICIYKIYLNIFTLFVCLHLPDISLPIFLIFNHMSLFFHKYISCEPYFVVIPSLRVLYVITDRFNIFTFIIFCYTGFVFLLLPYFGL